MAESHVAHGVNSEEEEKQMTRKMAKQRKNNNGGEMSDMKENINGLHRKANNEE